MKLLTLLFANLGGGEILILFLLLYVLPIWLLVQVISRLTRVIRELQQANQNLVKMVEQGGWKAAK